MIPTGLGRTPDFSINGGPAFELKTVSAVKDTTSDGISGAVSRRVMDARGQSRNVVIDARRQPNMTNAIAQRGIERGRGADMQQSPDGQGKINNITILTPEGQVRWSRN